jgi:hypothetical protein
MEEQEVVQQKSLSEAIAEDLTIKRIGGNVAAMYKEFKVMQDELRSTKETLEQTLISQQERIAIRKLELENDVLIRQIDHDKARELESHQWERSLPLQSDITVNLNEALNGLKMTDIELVKTGRNGRNGKAEGDDSTSLDDLLNAYEEPLATVGVDIRHQIISGFDIKNGDILRTSLYHTSGQFFSAYSKIKVDQVPSCSCIMQQRSSALKYAKRHNLQCLLGQ